LSISTGIEKALCMFQVSNLLSLSREKLFQRSPSALCMVKGPENDGIL
jgi:hypothetical protein